MLKQFSSLAIVLLVVCASSSEAARRGPIPSLEFPQAPLWQGRLSVPVATGAHRSHTVESGDTLWGIARRYGVTYNELASLNRFDTETVIQIGDKVRLPQMASNRARPPASSPTASQTHTVGGGETLYGISRRYGVTVAALKQANGIDDPSDLRAGHALKIPGTPPTPSPTPAPLQEITPVPAPTPVAEEPDEVPEATAPEPSSVEEEPSPPKQAPVRPTKTLASYHVQTGDTVESIAQTYGLTVDQLRRVNGRPNEDEAFLPKPGDKVLVPTDGSWYIPENPQAQATPTAATSSLDSAPYRKNRTMLMNHVVAPNDDLATLAKRFGTTVDQIRLENPGIRSNRDLRVGADLKIRIPRPL